jgi:PAS domain S-box-containing protein
MLQRFFTSQLRKALAEARTYAAELRDSEHRYRTLFDNVPAGLYRTTPDGRIVDANPALAQMLAYKDIPALCEVNAAGLYVARRDRTSWKRQMQRHGVVRDFETRFRRQDGEVIWINDTARAVRDQTGNVLYFEGSMEDITQRKEAEAELKRYQEHLEELVEQRTAELQKSEERYRTLFNGVPVGLYRSTPDGTVVDANEAVITMLGLSNLESVPNTETVYVDPHTRDRWKALMDQHGVVRDFECRMRRRDGTIVWAKDSARAVVDSQGHALYYEGSLEDISARKLAEEELQKAKEAAEAANQAKSQFLANMSHELRTPLNGIIGFTRLVRRRAADLLPQKDLDNLGKVLVSADQLLGLINDVLDLSKIEAGRTEVKVEAFDLTPLLDSCRLTVQPLIKSEKVQLVSEVPSDLPQLHTDRGKLRQVVLNLLGNAVKFTERGLITIRACCEDDVLTLSVSDTGIGIAANDLQRIFEAFQQVDASTTRRHGGTGLGLTISRQLAQAMGGDITVESEVGKGSTFTLTLPVHYAEASSTEPQGEG